MPTGAVVALVIAFAVVFVYMIARMGAAAGQKRGYSGMVGDTIVRCSHGHLFTTTWIVGSSVKAVRLGPKRYQRCWSARSGASWFPSGTTSSPTRTGGSPPSATTRSCREAPPHSGVWAAARPRLRRTP